jgi:excisionase family DNA binding protein
MSDTIPKMAFSVDEAAIRTDLGRDAIYAAVREGRLEAKKLGRRTLITADALRRFLDALPPLQLPPLHERRAVTREPGDMGKIKSSL